LGTVQTSQSPAPETGIHSAATWPAAIRLAQRNKQQQEAEDQECVPRAQGGMVTHRQKVPMKKPSVEMP
jgi:hypothetical protein